MTLPDIIVSRDVFEGRPALAAAAEDDTPLDLETAVWLPTLCMPVTLPGATRPTYWPIVEVRQLRSAISRAPRVASALPRLFWVVDQSSENAD